MLRQVYSSIVPVCSKARASFPRTLVSLVALALCTSPLFAGPANQLTQQIDLARVQPLANHHPAWANAANDSGPVPSNQSISQLTLVLSRSSEQEAAFAQFLADQQNPASPEYHHWLTPTEIGNRFGISDSDIAGITSWLQSQGLAVNWIAPSRLFIGFGGTAANIGRAFQSQLRNYRVNGVQRMSVASDPLVPQALTPLIKSIRGLYTISDQPTHHAPEIQSYSPEMSFSTSTHYITPADFQAIYDVPSSVTGSGAIIGIVGWSRTSSADFDNFRARTGTQFPNPTEVIPTAYGGVDPGPALTAPPTSNVSIDAQSEATLDILRAGSVAPQANLLLVVSAPQMANYDGIGADVQYLVQTSPVPAQIMSISFGACEASAGPSGVAFWDALFQQAAAEGISVFVASGDAGAAGCDNAFNAPPGTPAANSPNYICSSSYATCVGGTEFNDAADSSQYWATTNGTTLGSALSYIPEGAWNEPLNANSTPQVASTGGGVSSYISTPSWQTGTGVPSARSGRYTPDVAFASSCHDGYLGCLAAAGASCTKGSDGNFYFEYFCGTSAAAPGMAGIAALLNQSAGAPQGNLNPELYLLASTKPSAFHDATVASSGVTGCDPNIPSLCNNSVPGSPSAQPGYLLTAGYDEATGLGSLDAANFLSGVTGAVTVANPPKTSTTLSIAPNPAKATTSQSVSVAITLSTAAHYPAPTGTVTLTSGAYTSSPAALNASGLATITIPGGTLPAGADTLTVAYSGDNYYSATTASGTETVTNPPSFSITGSALTISSSGATSGNTATLTIAPTEGFTGNVQLTATVASGPSGALHPPTFNLSPSSVVTLTGAKPASVTLTVLTTAPGLSALTPPAHPGTRWYATGGATFACLLFLWIPRRARNLRNLLGTFAMLAFLASGLVACGGSATLRPASSSSASGTTPGSYAVTITGTSGATTATATINLNVQ
jgi:Pro-kumamolisin, activation domain/Bacterial Ig-like domain (group 3)